MSARGRRVEARWLGLNPCAQQQQAHVLAQGEGTGAVDAQAQVPEGVRLVVVVACLVLAGLRLAGRGERDVQQARRELPELAGDEQALWAAGVERHT